MCFLKKPSEQLEPLRELETGQKESWGGTSCKFVECFYSGIKKIINFFSEKSVTDNLVGIEFNCCEMF